MMVRKLIVNADDFGLAVPVNEAVEISHREGILTSASLMVGAPAAADAVQRARSLPSLKVGLHIVVVDGRPVLPPAELDALVELWESYAASQGVHIEPDAVSAAPDS